MLSPTDEHNSRTQDPLSFTLDARIPDVIEQAAMRRPDHLVFRLRRGAELETCTYGELVTRFRSAALALNAGGVRSGDRVVMVCENAPSWFITYLGGLRAGATMVPLDPALPASDLAKLFEAAAPRLVLASRSLIAKVREAACVCPVVDIDDELLVPEPRLPLLRAAPADPDADVDVASILFTSGTTGKPKGAMLLHAGLLHQGVTCGIPYYGFCESDELLMVLPLQHIYPFVSSLACLAAGGTMTFVEALRGDVIAAAMRETRPTVFLAVPRLLELFLTQVRSKVRARGPVARGVFALLKALVALGAKLGLDLAPVLLRGVHAAFGGRLRRVASAGAPLSVDVLRAFESLGFWVLQGYGLTETGGAATGSGYGDRRAGTVGHAMPSYEVRLASPSASGEGEICIRSPYIMRKYFRGPEATAEMIRDGWLYTGDLGRFDEAGFLSILGRLDELIVTATGKKAAPQDVERHYAEIPGVKELAVFGMPCSERAGEQIRAAVVLAERSDEARQAVETAVAARSAGVASHLQIQRLHFVSDIPKTTKLSVRRGELRRIVAALEPHSKDEAPVVEGEIDPLAAQVIAVVRRLLAGSAKRAPRVTVRSSLQFDLGIDSLGRTELAAALACEVGADVRAELASMHRVADVIGAVRGALALNQRGLAAAEPEPAAVAVPPPRSTLQHAVMTVLSLLARVMWKVEARGVENLPAGAFILCANHATNLDSLWMASVVPASLRARICSFAKRELWRHPATLYFARLASAIPVDREGEAQQALHAGIEVLRSGRPLLVFPEGTRSKTGALGAFRAGAARMALAAGVPIVPACLIGSHAIYPPHRKLPRFPLTRKLRRHKVTIHFGAPLHLEGKAGNAQAEQACTERLRNAVAALARG